MFSSSTAIHWMIRFSVLTLHLPSFKGSANAKKGGSKLSLRYGLYSSGLDRYRRAFNKNYHPQRIIFFDGQYYTHGVKPVLKNERYTIATWYK